MALVPKAIAGMTPVTVSGMGKSFAAYVCGPKGAPGVIVLQEWWGITDQIQKQAQRIASQGYRCLVPDLYKGKLTLDHEEASHMMTNLDFPGAVTEIRAAAAFLKKEGSAKCGVTGFCMGGALSLATAVVNEDDVACAAPFYGIPDKQYFDCSKIKIPIQGHFGELDPIEGFSDQKTAKELQSTLSASGTSYDVFMYAQVGHGFMNEGPFAHGSTLKQDYSPEAADTGYRRLFEFFNKHLGGWAQASRL